SDAVTGTFNGLPEGAVFSRTTGSFTGTFQITYVGGDGNDVVLKTLSSTTPSLDGTPGNDTFSVKRNAGNTEVTLNGFVILSSATLTGLTINGLAGNDTLTVDLSAGDIIPT